jgi:hypothetical protein
VQTPATGLSAKLGCYNYLPRRDEPKVDREGPTRHLLRLEDEIRQKIEHRCETAGNYQYQSAYRTLCDADYLTAGGMTRSELKLRVSELLGLEITEEETDMLFNKFAGENRRVDVRQMVKYLLQPIEERGGWFLLKKQIDEPMEGEGRITTSACFKRQHPSETEHLDPALGNHEFPTCLNGFRWDLEKFVWKLKSKINEHAQGHAGYLFLAACKIFRHALPHREKDQITASEFKDIVRLKFALHCLDEDCYALFEHFEPGCNGRMRIRDLVRKLSSDYTRASWFSTRESTDMPGYKARPAQVVLQAEGEIGERQWNIDTVEEKIRNKVHERVGAVGKFEVQATYRLFLDGRDKPISKPRFKRHMHDKFTIVLTDEEIDAIYHKHDPHATGFIDLYKFVMSLVGRSAPPEPMFLNRETYELRLRNGAPMKKDPAEAPAWKNAGWDLARWELELHNKIWAKSVQDGGRFAFKSAMNVMRSSNPDTLDPTRLTREGLRFVVFRRFDIVMNDQLLDEVFAKYGDPKTQKVPIQVIVRAMLQPAWDGSHHLVPKTQQQSNATRSLMQNIFAVTGKRREIMVLNGAGGRLADGDTAESRDFIKDMDEAANKAANPSSKTRSQPTLASVSSFNKQNSQPGPEMSQERMSPLDERERALDAREAELHRREEKLRTAGKIALPMRPDGRRRDFVDVAGAGEDDNGEVLLDDGDDDCWSQRSPRPSRELHEQQRMRLAQLKQKMTMKQRGTAKAAPEGRRPASARFYGKYGTGQEVVAA